MRRCFQLPRNSEVLKVLANDLKVAHSFDARERLMPQAFEKRFRSNSRTRCKVRPIPYGSTLGREFLSGMKDRLGIRFRNSESVVHSLEAYAELALKSALVRLVCDHAELTCGE